MDVYLPTLCCKRKTGWAVFLHVSAISTPHAHIICLRLSTSSGSLGGRSPETGTGDAIPLLCHSAIYQVPGKCLPFPRLRKAFQDVEQGAVQLCSSYIRETKLFFAHNCSLLKALQWTAVTHQPACHARKLSFSIVEVQGWTMEPL